MIQAYSERLQLDVCQIYDYIKQKSYQAKDNDKDLDVQIGCAAVRILGALGMAFGVLIGVSTLTMIGSSPVGAVLVMASGICFFALNQDIFIIAQNVTEQRRSGRKVIMGTGRAIGKYVSDMCYGKISERDAVPQTITEGTNFRPLWDKVIAESKRFSQSHE